MVRRRLGRGSRRRARLARQHSESWPSTETATGTSNYPVADQSNQRQSGVVSRTVVTGLNQAGMEVGDHALQPYADISQEHVTFLRSPFKVSYYSSLYLRKQLRATAVYAVQYPQPLTYSIALGCVYTALHFVHGPHIEIFHSLDAWVGWYSYWVLLGVLSSIGLGAGLHTFVLFLGPHIARVTLTAHECPDMSFSVRGSGAFECLSGYTAAHAPFAAIMRKVILESLCWGAGTAVGELPPYFIARAGAAAGSGDAEYQHLRSKAAAGCSLSLKDRALLNIYGLLRRFGFAGILAFAAIPNPLFDLAGITCGHFQVPFWTFFGATFIGKSAVKATIQSSVVITAFSKEMIAIVLSFLRHISPWAHDLAERILRQQAATLSGTHTYAPNSASEAASSLSLLGSMWNACVSIMLIYFVISTLEAFAQSYLAEVKNWGQSQLARVGSLQGSTSPSSPSLSGSPSLHAPVNEK